MNNKQQAPWQQRFLLARLPIVSELNLGKSFNNWQAIAAKKVVNLVLAIEKQVAIGLAQASLVAKSKNYIGNDDFPRKNDDTYRKNDDSYRKNDDFHIGNNDFPRENDNFHRKNDSSHIGINEFPRENDNFHRKNDDFHRNAKNYYLGANRYHWHIKEEHCRGSPTGQNSKY